MQILVCHPEFWLGGAEAVVFDMIIALKNEGHNIYLATGHCDPFWVEKLKNNVIGMICGAVSMPGDWFHGNHFTVLRARLSWGDSFDLIILDCCPGVAPLLKLLFTCPIYYYCHFPYQLMVPRNRLVGWLMFIEMWLIEGWCLNFCDFISTNSLYTTKSVQRCFPTIANRRCQLLHPAVPTVTSGQSPVRWTITPKKYFLSLNRYWPDKRIDIAIQALKTMKHQLDEESWNSVHLVVAGSVEHRMADSVHCRNALKQMAEDHGLSDKITFLENIEADRKVQLLRGALAVLYTPPMEHFGITPLEAAHFGRPVIAVHGCGSMETVWHGRTGLLVPATPQAFAAAMASMLNASGDQLRRYSESCAQWIERKFSANVFRRRFFSRIEMINFPEHN